jgi:hypothetical protein
MKVAERFPLDLPGHQEGGEISDADAHSPAAVRLSEERGHLRKQFLWSKQGRSLRFGRDCRLGRESYRPGGQAHHRAD